MCAGEDAHHNPARRYWAAIIAGIVLIIEMTGLGNQAITLLIACIPATVIPFLLGRRSIYDELRERLPGRQKLPENP